MSGKKIALVAGGYSGEYVISVNSARIIKKHIDRELFDVYLIIIDNSEWYYLNDREEKIIVDKNDFSVLTEGEKIHFDAALITIHGTPGEDGRLQGYLDMIGVPYTTAGVLASSLTFNKFYCNLLVKQWNIKVANSIRLHAGNNISTGEILNQITLPVFIKPNKGGSSLGTTFVKSSEDILQAVKLCLEHDDEALIEEYIEGTELTCGVYRASDQVVVLPVTEIVSKTEAKFFDYKAKYTKGAADEITPARIDDRLKVNIQDTTRFLYQKLDLKGICRLDYIFSNGELFFLEANITPGMSERSIVPQQAEYAGISMKEMFTGVILQCLKK